MSYKTLTLGELIKQLETIGEDLVTGFDPNIESYRGYYDRNALTASANSTSGSEMARKLKAQVGKQIHGYKGGDYRVSLAENVYLADYGTTGPNICGFTKNHAGVHVPVLVEVQEW